MVRDWHLSRERQLRLPIALLILLPAALYIWWWRREAWEWRTPLIGAALYFVVWNLNYFAVRRYPYSISLFNYDGDIEPFFSMRVIEAMIVLVIAALVIAIMRRRAAPGEVARGTVHMLFLVALGLMLQILLFYVLWNVTFTWALPDMTLGFKYYLDVFVSTVFWPMLAVPFAALLPLIAMGAAWLAGKVRRNQASA